MLVKLFVIVCFFIEILFCLRRILDPQEPLADKPYMVYMVMAPQSDSNYTGWMCGGVIVHPYFVLTAASCLHDVKYAYVISGYKKYVPSENIEADSCTSIIKKRVVHICAHTRYRWSHYVLSWSTAETGFARVDTPFDHRDKNYQKCSYPPKPIPMSFIPTEPGEDAIVLGWGHTQYFRPVGDEEDYNMDTLQYSPVQVANVTECLRRYAGHEDGLLEYYSICAKSGGDIDSEGNRLLPTELKYGCINELKLKGVATQKQKLLPEEHRCNRSSRYFYDSRKMFTDESYPKEMMNTRRGGICQNDHGGPLVMWRGGRETVVGVATMFLVTGDMECHGPFLFMSLHCINLFAHCLFPDLVHLGRTAHWTRLAICNATARERGFEMLERTLSWKDYGKPKICSGQRRIVKGSEVNREKRYLVYFLSSEDEETTYRDWLCAGALISTSHVLTAAACLTDVSRMYVVAGYKKYVNGMDIEKDSCISKRKRRVMRICTPKAYNMNYEKVRDWMKIDIGIATVDEPYDFSDNTFRLDCSYPPGMIEINYDPYLQKKGTNAIVLGWGALKRYRQPDDIQDTNSEYLRYSKIRLSPVESCVKYFTNHSGAGDVIKEFMICSMSEGFLDIDGKETKGTQAHDDGCRPNQNGRLLRTLYNISDEDDNFDWRRAKISAMAKAHGGDYHHDGDTSYEDYSQEGPKTKPGFCQNDHGGPLVTWSGSKEYVIGVASACRVHSETLLCLPPFLYTSTYCTGLFLQCVLSGSATSEIRRKCAEIAKEKGITIEDRPVTWPEESQSLDTNKQEPVQPSQQQQQDKANQMRLEDYITEDKPIETVLRSNNVTTEIPTETNETTEKSNPVENSNESEQKGPEEDYNPLEMILNLSNKIKEEKPLIEQKEKKTLRTATETVDFDPLAILQEDFADETPEPNEDKNYEEVTEVTAGNITEQSESELKANIVNITEDTGRTVTENKTNKTEDANKENKN